MKIVDIPTQNGFKIDWLTISFRQECNVSASELLEKVVEIMGCDFSQFILFDSGTSPGYNESYRYLGEKFITINNHSESLKQGTLLNITGRGTLFFSNEQFARLLIYAKEKNAYFTRLDIAFDDVEKEMPIDLINEIGRRVFFRSDYPNLGVSTKITGDNIRAFSNGARNYKYGDGINVTVGSRYSTCIVRAYNKAVEQKLKEIYWWRLELQLKYERAEVMVDYILKNEVSTCFLYYLDEYFRVIDFKSSSSQANHVSTNKRWVEFLKKLKNYKLLLPQIYI